MTRPDVQPRRLRLPDGRTLTYQRSQLPRANLRLYPQERVLANCIDSNKNEET